MKKYLVPSLVALVLLLSGCIIDRGNNPNPPNSNEVGKEQQGQEKPKKQVEPKETQTPKESESKNRYIYNCRILSNKRECSICV